MVSERLKQMIEEEHLECPKCGKLSGDDWSQCDKKCPVSISPYYDRETFRKYGHLRKENN